MHPGHQIRKRTPCPLAARMLPKVTNVSPSPLPRLVEELILVRDAGLPRLRHLTLPALTEAARQVADEPDAEPQVLIEQLLRRAVEQLGGGAQGEAAAVLFGLEGGTRGLAAADRRRQAADCFGRTFSTFRQRYEPDVVNDVALAIQQLVVAARMRVAHSQLERRHPAESRLAVAWVERFEAYYRIWTPVMALGGDLTAYRATLLETDRPYDRAPGIDGPDDPGYSQELQAEGYARDALYHYACFEWELKQFIQRYGGLWLLSDATIETAVSDAVYRISWHVTPFNERDQSWLRGTIADSRGGEVHYFLNLLARTSIGQATHREWQEWVATCQCRWEEVPDANHEATERPEYFPTSAHHPGIEASCQVHQVITACGRYADLIDLDWHKIADWYHLGDRVRRGVSAEGLYRGWRRG
jgi:hypothetical protein